MFRPVLIKIAKILKETRTFHEKAVFLHLEEFVLKQVDYGNSNSNNTGIDGRGG